MRVSGGKYALISVVFVRSPYVEQVWNLRQSAVGDVEVETGLLMVCFEELSRALSIARERESYSGCSCSRVLTERTNCLCLHSWCLSSCIRDPLTVRMSIGEA